MLGNEQQEGPPVSFETDNGGSHPFNDGLPSQMVPHQDSTNPNLRNSGDLYAEDATAGPDIEGNGFKRGQEGQQPLEGAPPKKQRADGGLKYNSKEDDTSSSITASSSDTRKLDPDIDPNDTGGKLIPPGKEAITTFEEHDVLSGRGGGTNVHPGNRDFRDLINKYRTIYLKAKKNDKPGISRTIVKEIRSKGGRFLKKDERSGLFFEIGDAQAREKTSQALRQRAPEMRKLMFNIHQQHAGSAILAAGEQAGPIHPGPPTHAMAGMTEEQYRWAVESMNQQSAAHSFQAMGAMHGMGGSFNPLMGASPANAGPIMGASAFNPALFHAMMAGMGGFPPSGGFSPSGGVVMPPYHQNAAQPEVGAVEGVSGENGGDFGGISSGSAGAVGAIGDISSI